MIAPDFARIPSALKDKEQWVLHVNKVPHTPANEAASSADSETWCTFDAAVAAYQRGGFDGIGFVPLVMGVWSVVLAERWLIPWHVSQRTTHGLVS
jgi:hypothetical protein